MRVCRPILIGGNALILCLVLFWIVPGIDVQGPWTPAHRYLRVTCHVEILPVAPPWKTSWSGVWKKRKSAKWFVLLNVLSASTKMFCGLCQLLHGMRVSLSFTLYDHGVFRVNNVFFHWLLYDGWGLSDCRKSNKSAKYIRHLQYNDKTICAINYKYVNLLTHFPEGCRKSNHSAIKVAAALVWPVWASLSFI